MTKTLAIKPSETLADTLTTISVVSKLLARKVKEEEINEQNERTK